MRNQQIYIEKIKNVLSHLKNNLKVYLWLIVSFLGFAQTWVSRYAVNPDAVSYLDIGDAYLRGDWKMAINAMWSPLYSVLLGTTMFFLKPSPDWEYPVAHLVNFILFLAALVSFNFYLPEIIRERRERLRNDQNGNFDITEPMFLLIAYLVFVWSTLVLIKIKHIVPDLGVMAIVFLVAGLLLRIQKRSSTNLFVLLGIALGVGYLAKAPMLLLSAVFLLSAAILVRKSAQSRWQISVAIICFACVAAPFIAALSLAKNKITFGENGKLNYAWHVNGVQHAHWQGDNLNEGTPIHPTRKILDQPAVYEFGTPLVATYPVWYDPSYWYEGVAFRFDLIRQLRKIGGQILIYYLPMFSFHGLFLVFGMLALFFLSSDKREFLSKTFISHWYLYIPAFAALLMYSLVHVETRYVAPFVAIIIISIVSGMSSVTVKRKKLARAILIAALGFSIVPATLAMSAETISNFVAGKDTGDNHRLIVAQLKNVKIKQNDKIASLGRADLSASEWARLAKLKIVAEIYDQSDVDFYWQADFLVKQKVIDAFVKSGAKFIVTTNAPASAKAAGWQHLPGTNVDIYQLPESAPLTAEEQQ